MGVDLDSIGLVHERSEEIKHFILLLFGKGESRKVLDKVVQSF